MVGVGGWGWQYKPCPDFIDRQFCSSDHLFRPSQLPSNFLLLTELRGFVWWNSEKSKRSKGWVWAYPNLASRPKPAQARACLRRQAWRHWWWCSCNTEKPDTTNCPSTVEQVIKPQNSYTMKHFSARKRNEPDKNIDREKYWKYNIKWGKQVAEYYGTSTLNYTSKIHIQHSYILFRDSHMCS